MYLLGSSIGEYLLGSATYDGQPIATMAAPSAVQTGQFNVQVTFDEPMTELSAGDFQFSFPSSAFYDWALSGAGQSFILSVIPPANFNGPVTITLPAGSGANALGYGTVAAVSVVVQIDTTQIPTNPTVISIGGDNIIAPGETVTIQVQDITLANIDQVVLAGGGGEYAIPFNGIAQVTIPTFVPAGTYTLKLREFA